MLDGDNISLLAQLLPREVVMRLSDPELPAQLRHLLAIEQASHKPQALIHLATLPPRQVFSRPHIEVVAAVSAENHSRCQLR